MLCLPLSAFAADSLYVKGNKIFYGNREVMLQGVAVGDPLIAREGRPLSDYQLIADDWNANVVRISVHPGTWRDYGRKKVIDMLRRDVQAALAAHMFVIICWQAIGVPDVYTQPAPDGFQRDLYDTNFDLAKDFWKEISMEFGQDGRIMFELWNEPVWPVQADGSQVQPKWKELKPRWETLIGLVRFYSDNLVIVTSNGWGYNLQSVRNAPMEDSNTAYAWHIYAGTDGNDPGAWERNLDGLQDIKPVLVTEWGFEPDVKTDKAYGTAKGFGYLFADRFIRDKHLHYTAWCWHSDWTPRMWSADWKSPTSFGNFIKGILWRVDKKTLVRP